MRTRFFILIPLVAFFATTCTAQNAITVRDTVVDIGGVTYKQRIVTTSEVLNDTLSLRARLNEIDSTISNLRGERKLVVSQLEDFKLIKGLSIQQSKQPAKKQPARKPKKSKQ